jgi:hypothetical protein
MADPLAQFAHLRDRRIKILSPIYRQPAAEYTQSLVYTMATMTRLGIHTEVTQVVGDAMLPRARNQLVAGFLAGTSEDAFFIDADMQWDPTDILRLLLSEQLLIGAPCRRREETPEDNPRSWCLRFRTDSAGKIRQDKQGAMEVESAGLAFTRMNRQVFERLIAAHPDWKRPGSESLTPQEREHYYRFFRFGEEEDLGEDVLFHREWLEIGGTAWIAPALSIGHVGTTVYRGSVYAMLRRTTPQPS